MEQNQQFRNSPLEPDSGALRPAVPCTSQVSCLGPFREKTFNGVFVKHLTSLFVTTWPNHLILLDETDVTLCGGWPGYHSSLHLLTRSREPCICSLGWALPTSCWESWRIGRSLISSQTMSKPVNAKTTTARPLVAETRLRRKKMFHWARPNWPMWSRT